MYERLDRNRSRHAGEAVIKYIVGNVNGYIRAGFEYFALWRIYQPLLELSIANLFCHRLGRHNDMASVTRSASVA